MCQCAILSHRPLGLDTRHNPGLPGQQTTADLTTSHSPNSPRLQAGADFGQTGRSFAPSRPLNNQRGYEPEVPLPRSSERLLVDCTGAVGLRRSCGRGGGRGGGGREPVPEDGGGGGELGVPLRSSGAMVLREEA